MNTWEIMKKISEKNVQAHECCAEDFDFDEFDCEEMAEGEPFVWGIFEYGTCLMRLIPENKEVNVNEFNFHKDFKDIRFFLIEKNRSFKAISRKTAENLIDAIPDAS